MSLSRRPLTSSEADAELFVDRDDEISRIERSVELRANVLVVGPPGSGKTSLLRRLQARSREAGDEWVYVDCSPWEELDHALAAIGAALGRETRNRPRLVNIEDWQLERSVVALEGPEIVTESDVHGMLTGVPRVIAVDGLRPELAFDLFGRFRDTLWEHKHVWVVGIDDVHRGELLRPPANAFFETVVDIDELHPPDVGELLLRRLDGLSGRDQERLREVASILGEHDQPPRHPGSAIAVAREALSREGAVERLLSLRRDAEALAENLGPTAAEVFRGLTELGPVHAGDDRLVHRVGLSRARIVQVLKELEGAGLVHSWRNGRRSIYEVGPFE